MDICDFENIQPFVRMVKIKKSLKLKGSWEDLDHVMIYIAHGTAVYSMGDCSYSLDSGQLVLIPPYLYHSLNKQGEENLVQYILHFDLFTTPLRQSIPHQSAETLSPKPELPACENLFHNTAYIATIPSEDRFQFENLFLQMYREFSQTPPGYQSMLRGMATQIIFTILRSIPREKFADSETDQKQSKPAKLVKSALEYIYLHYSEDLENSTIAEAMEVSPNYLTKIFRQHVGISLHKYVTAYRLEQSQQMLASGKYNITEVAQKCGFSSIHIFSKLFKQECGISPSAYVATLPEHHNQDHEKADYARNKQTFYNL